MYKKLIALLFLMMGSILLVSAEELPVVRAALFPLREAVISARVDSVMNPSPLRIGSTFKQNEVLATLDSSRYQIELKRCQQLAAFAKAQYEDRKELRQKDFTSDFELKKAEHDYRMTLSSLEDAKLNYSFCTITAPFNGKISDFITHEFETVRPGQPLIRIIDDHELLAVANPPLSWGIKAKPGTAVKLKLSDGRIITGKVYEQAPAADNRTETIRLRILIDNRSGKLCAGMTGELIYGK